MAATIHSIGDIESICQKADALTAGSSASVVFRSWDDASAPFTVKVRDPDGKIILDRVIRDLPTGKPQSAPPITFVVAASGIYKLEIRELYGKVGGQATLTVT